MSLGETEYAYSARNLTQLIKSLRDAGIEEVVQLPRVAVIGNQSSGKSSLIEAICQIKVPRASGTCTRCPTEIILSTSEDVDEWRSIVSLRLQHDAPHQRSGTYLIGTTTRKEDIPQLVSRAQLAVLNPLEDPSSFRNFSEEECSHYKSALTFSRDVVVIEVIGADIDITFVDLPGLITNVSNSSEICLISLVGDLATSYAAQTNCLILTVFSMRG